MKNLRIFTISMFLMACVSYGCEPKKGTVEDKEAVKNDSIDVREGEGEGESGTDHHR